jgi:CHAD domain-containing protein
VKQLELFAKKQFKKLIDDLESYHHLQDPEVLHQIRVEIKKIKTLLNLINYCVKKFKGHQHFIPFRTIFRRAGEIRQPLVFYKLLLMYQIEGVRDAQVPKSKKLDKLSIAFKKDVPLFIESVKRKRKELSKFILQVKKIDSNKYLKKRKRELERFLFPTLNKPALHKARKVCKEIVYLQGLNKKPVDSFYSDVEKRIGQWHDKQLLLPILKKNKKLMDIKKLAASSLDDLIALKKLVALRHEKLLLTK